MAIAENFPAGYKETGPQLEGLGEPPTEFEEHEIDGVVIPMTTPNFLGLISMGVRFLGDSEQFDIKDTYLRDVSLNGNGKTIPHDHRTDVLIHRNPRSGLHEVSRQSPAVHLDMLLMHLEMREIAAKAGRPFVDRGYTFTDSNGEIYESMSILNLQATESKSPTIQSEAVFEYPKINDNEPQIVHVPVASIVALAPVGINKK